MTASSVSDTAPGYTDTPFLPGGEYRVHDADRPRPAAVDPGEPLDNGAPPGDATVLLDEDGLHGWEQTGGGTVAWIEDGGVVTVEPGSGDINTTDSIGDCQLHLEWAAPPETEGDGQGRGNSGVFLMDRYEIQVLDTYDNPTYADGYAGAVYGQHPPLVNPVRPPGEWQSYDILWQAPRFDGDAVDTPARVSVLFNRVTVQHATAVFGPTTHRDVSPYEPHGDAPLRLQDHGDRVRFRNIWYRSVE